MLPLELSDLAGTRAFAMESLQQLAEKKERLDYLLLNAAITGGNEKGKGGVWGWNEAGVVNHLCEFFLS